MQPDQVDPELGQPPRHLVGLVMRRKTGGGIQQHSPETRAAAVVEFEVVGTGPHETVFPRGDFVGEKRRNIQRCVIPMESVICPVIHFSDSFS